MKKLINLITTTAFLLTIFLPARLALAATATLSLSPSSGSVSNGNTVTLDIHVNSGSDAVNFVDAELTYPSDKYDWVSTNSSSAYDVNASSPAGGGSISVNRGTSHSGGLAGDQVVASIVMRAKVASGSGGVNFSGTSKVYSATTNNNIYAGGGSGANYSFTAAPAPAPTPTPTPTPTPAPSGGGSTSSGSSTTKPPAATTTTARPAISTSTSTGADSTPPTISDVSVTQVTATSAVVSWTSSEPSKSEVDYGIDQKYGYSAVDQNLVSDHKLMLDSTDITASTLYHFIVKSTDAAGNTATSNDSNFTTADAGAAAPAKKSLSVAKIGGVLLLLAVLFGGFILWRRRGAGGDGAPPLQPPQQPTLQQPPAMPQPPIQQPPTTFVPPPPAAQ